ncbi:MAG: alpha/beta fold hydrolase [Chitinophagaceae bacterium]|nr:alpha/beta fold hydrolase [Chitinophagaceae bacterium]
MQRFQFLIILFSLSLISCEQQRIIPKGFTYDKPEGFSDSVYSGYIDVYENRLTNTGKKIQLYVLIIPALTKSNNPPLFLIDGGPGVSATASADFYTSKENPYRQNRDIVVVDVRGTGKSNPLMCPSLQVKENLQQQFDEMYPATAVKECYDLLSKENDLTQYHTANIVMDLEEVRIKLGYKKISLFGLSYGTRVALQYLRMFPQAIESTVLWSPVTTYASIPLYHAIYAEASLSRIWNDCKKDTGCNTAYPSIQKEFTELMNQWKKKPFAYVFNDSNGTNKTLTISWNAFQTKLRSLMYSPAGIRKVPYIVHEAWKGNLQPFIDLFPNGKEINNFIAEGLYLCVTCTEDVPFIQTAAIDSLTAGTFMGTYRVDQQKQACANWTKWTIPIDFLQPISSSVPTLILTGSFDPVTPPSMAKEISSTLPNSQLVEIPYMSHVFDGLQNEFCFDQMVIDFLNAPMQKLKSTDCIKLMTPPAYKTK